MDNNGLHITAELVRTAIEQRCNLVSLTLNDSLGEFGLRDFQLINIRIELNNRFGKDVVVRMTDTIYSLTDRLTGNAK